MASLIASGHSSNGSADFGDVSSSLLLGLREFDQRAWERLVALYGPLVYLWCRDAGLQAEDAADVGQEVFRAISRKIGEFRRDRPGDSFRGWSRMIARNKILDFLRRRSKQVNAAGGSDALNNLLAAPDSIESATDGSVFLSGKVSPSSERRERRLLFRRALELVRASFEERTWLAFWHVTVDERSPKDVAMALNMSPGAVYTAKSKILRRLREEFGEVVDF